MRQSTHFRIFWHKSKLRLKFLTDKSYKSFNLLHSGLINKRDTALGNKHDIDQATRAT